MRWVVAACLLCLGLTPGVAGELNWGTWAEEVRKQHPLAGSFYIASTNRLFSVSDEREGFPLFPGLVLSKRLGFILLGEVHDNPVHHQLRAWLIDLLGKQDRDLRP